MRNSSTCLLWLVVGTDGKTHYVRKVRSLGLGLDEKSIDAVSTCQFEPATRNGQPVAVQINVEVSFRLYSSPGVPPGLDGEPFQLPQKYSVEYPLHLQLRFVIGKRSEKGYVVTAEATILGDAHPSKVMEITCGPKGKCFMLKAAKYPARWVSSTEVELLGLNEDNQKWQKAHFSVKPAS